MKRVKISNDGIAISKPGYDVDTAPPEGMAFSTDMVAARVESSGTVTVSGYSGYMSSHCDRAIVYFAQPKAVEPVVLVAGLYPDGSTEQAITRYDVIPLGSGTAYILPCYSVESFKDRFELYVHTRLGGQANTPSGMPLVWRYWVLANNLA